MVPVDPRNTEDQATLDRLLVQVDAQDAELVQPRASLPPCVHFALTDQLSFFKETHPDGFGETWKRNMRGQDAVRRLKRHRDAAIAQMQAAVTASELTRALEGRCSEVWLSICDVLDGTDLVATSAVATLRKSARRATPSSVSALGEVLFGAGDFSDRFDRYVQSLQRLTGKVPSWELVTTILGLTDPRAQVCVRRASFQQQAEWIMPELRSTSHPNALAYGAFLRLAQTVCQELESNGLAPQDYLDVYDFIKIATAPRAVQHMAQQRQLRGPVSAGGPRASAHAA
jgi:hypothetical protein